MKPDAPTLRVDAPLQTSVTEEVSETALSYGQQALCFLHASDPGSPVYNVSFAVRIYSMLDAVVAERVLQKVFERHPAFRTTFPFVNGAWIQKIQQHGSVPFQEIDVSELSEKGITDKIQAVYKQPFDLENGPLFRTHLLRKAKDDAILLLVAHHIVCDGWSVGVLISDLKKLFEAESSGQQAVLQTLEVDYTTHVQHQQEILASSKGEELREYWQDKLSGDLPILNLPLSYPRPPLQTFNGASYRLDWADTFSQQIRDFGKRQRVSPFIVLLSGFYTLLHRYSGQQDLVIGTPFSGRTEARFNGVVGDFVNPLVLRAEVSGSMSFRDLLTQSRRIVMEALTHQEYPFSLLVENLKVKRDLSRPPLFEVMVNYIQMPERGDKFVTGASGRERTCWGDMEVEPYSLNQQEGQLSLTFDTYEAGTSLSSVLTYNTDLFAPDLIERMGQHLKQILQHVLQQPDGTIAQLPMLTEHEQKQLGQWNAPLENSSQAISIHRLFEKQAVNYPEKIAVAYGQSSLSYKALNERANQVAHALLKQEVLAGALVGIYLVPSLETIISILGVLKAGCAYISIDPDYTEERVRYVLDDSACRIVLTQDDLSPRIHALSTVETLLVAATVIEKTTTPVVPESPDTTAYIMYIFDPIDQPKGCMVTHNNVVRSMNNDAHCFNFCTTDVWVLAHSCCFDFSVWEMYGALLHGGKLLIPEQNDLRDEVTFLQLIKAHKVSVLNQVPEAFYNLIREESRQPSHTLSDHLRYVFLRGGKLESSNFQQWIDHYDLDTIHLIDMYGTTETTVYASFYRLTLADLEPTRANRSIGIPLPGTTIHIYDPYLNPLPIGILGEIYVGGSHVCKGYLNRSKLTAAHFIPDPSQPSGGLLYKTGDWAKRLPGGFLEYCDPNDDQVGTRERDSEIKEAEQGLYNHEAVNSSKHATNVAANQFEEKLLLIWQQVLGETVPFGVTDNYFDLGGDKRNAEQLISRLKHEFQASLTLRDVFQKPTIRMMAESLQSRLSMLAADGASGVEHRTLSRLYQDDISVISTEEYSLLSNAQSRLFDLEKLSEAAPAYTVPFALKLEGELKMEALQQAFQTLLQRHDSLRTVFVTVEGESRQKVQPKLSCAVDVSDFRQFENQQQRLQQAIDDEVQRPFSLVDGPLIRLQVLQLGDRSYIILFNVHYIVGDGISLGVCVQELFKLYQAYHSNTDNNPLSPLRIQYRDYVAWQERLLVSEWGKQASLYWHDKLAGEPPVLELPTDFPRPKTQSYRGNMLHIPLDDMLAQGLFKLAQQQNVTLFVLLLAMTKTLLYKYTGQNDIIVGSPVKGREHSDLEGQVGLYSNTLALRNYLMGEDSFVEVLEQVQNTVTEAHEYQFYPFERLADELELERNLIRLPVFNVMVALQKVHKLQLSLDGIKATHYPISHAVSKLDLTFEFLESDGQPLTLLLEYNTDLFTETTAKNVGSHLQCLFGKILEQPSIRLGELNLLNADEQKQMLRQASGPQLDFPIHQTLVELFEAQAKRTPQAVAVASERGELSYAALNRQANQLAYRLKNHHNCCPDMRIGLMLNRTDRILVGILAILKTGGAYVPLDPTYPVKRIRYMLEDTGCSVIVSETEFVAQLLEYDLAQVVDLTDKSIYENSSKPHTQSLEATDLTATVGDANPPLASRASSLAYVIYTSGSTGQPKGVMVEQQAVVNLVHGMQEKIYQYYDHPVREAFSATYTFDVSVQQIFATLLLGNTLVMLGQEVISDPRLLFQCLETQPVDIVDLTPGQFAALLDVGMADSDQLKVRQITIGSETLSPDLVTRFYERQSHSSIRLINMYGPTECCVDSTCQVLDALTFDPTRSVPIGKPLANIQAYVLDHDYQLAPVGMEGEICIGGAGLARGYLNQARLTASKFIPHLVQPDSRLYTTGDRGRWLPDGNLEFGGRKDNQVKVRGFRIELGDIEQAFLLHPKVKSAIVIIRSVQDHNELLAYAVMRDNSVPMAELKSHLQNLLPSHMIPAHIMELDSLPLNSIGKIDKKALPAPEAAVQHETCVMPRNATEEKLVLIWQDVLNRDVISISDNFFDLGGHSLNAVQVLIKANQQLGAEIPLMALFQSPTIEQLATTIENTSAYEQAPVMCLNETYSSHVFCLPPIFGYGIAYQSIASGIQGYSLHGLDWVGGESPVDTYVKAIIQVQPGGDYRLLGYSAGGNLAIEVARELVRQGHNVIDIILLDAARLSETHLLSEKELDRQAVVEFGNYATLMMGDESLKNFVDGSSFKSQMLQNIKDYLSYLASTVNTAGLEANIHVLTSTTQFNCDYGWQEVTNGKVIYHSGMGEHAQMLFGDFALQNALILQRLIDEL